MNLRDESLPDNLARYVANGPTGTTQPPPAWRARITRGEDGQAVTLADVVSIDRHVVAAVLRAVADRIGAPAVVSDDVTTPAGGQRWCPSRSPGGERACLRLADVAHVYHSDGVYEWDGHGSIRPARPAYATLAVERGHLKGVGTPQGSQRLSGAIPPPDPDINIQRHRDMLRDIVVAARDTLRRHGADTNVHLAAAVEAVIADRDRLRAELEKAQEGAYWTADAEERAQRRYGKLHQHVGRLGGQLGQAQRRAQWLESENERLTNDLVEAREQRDKALSRTRLAETRAARCCDGHHVQINARDRLHLRNWLINPNGSFVPESGSARLTIDAVEGGGILVRTQPYRHPEQTGEQRHVCGVPGPEGLRCVRDGGHTDREALGAGRRWHQAATATGKPVAWTVTGSGSIRIRQQPAENDEQS